MPRAYMLAEPLSLVLYKGHVGFWSSDERADRQCVWLDARQVPLLLQFSSEPKQPAQAAAALGLEYGGEVEALVQQLIHHQVLREHVAVCDRPFHRFHHPERDDVDAPCVVEPDALDEPGMRAISDGLERSKLIGGNVLSDGFAGSRGFGVKFRREALGRVLDWLPWTRRYFDRVIEHVPARRLVRGDDGAPPNAFYFNALVIPPGRGTALHIDRTIDNRTPAALVSVLYLTVTAPPGGRLFLYDGRWPLGIVHPRPGMLVHFRGDLRHGVSETSPSDGDRISLVCEQYCLPEAALRQCPFLELVTASS
jgi:hypothetical protein